jgi:hypothetical protein
VTPEVARQWLQEFFVSPGLALLMLGLYAVQGRIAWMQELRHRDNQHRMEKIEARLSHLERQRGRENPWPETR